MNDKVKELRKEFQGEFEDVRKALKRFELNGAEQARTTFAVLRGATKEEADVGGFDPRHRKRTSSNSWLRDSPQ